MPPTVPTSQKDAQRDDAKWTQLVLAQARKCRSTSRNAPMDERYEALGLTKAQAKLLECVYYGQGAMYGSTKLYSYIASLDKDNQGETPLRAGDTVVILDAEGNRMKPLNVVYIVQGRIRGSGLYRIALKAGLEKKQSYKRERLRLITGITKRQVRGWLKHQKVWQLSTRPVKGYRPDRPFTQAQPGKTLQIDLINIMDNKDKYVEGVALMVIDVYTRKGWAATVSAKTSDLPRELSDAWKKAQAPRVAAKLVKLLKDDIFAGDTHPSKLRISSDNGPEFSAPFRRRILQYSEPLGMKVEFKYGIPNVPTSQAYVERFNQTVKGIMYRLRDSGRSGGWQYNLQVAVLKYNKTKHSLHKRTPAAVWRDVRQDPEKEYIKADTKKASVPETPLKKGDFVRVQRGKKGTQHYYRRNYTDQIFQIDKVVPPEKYGSGRYKYTLTPYTDRTNIEYIYAGKDRGKPPTRYVRQNLLLLPDGTPYENPRGKRRVSTFEKWCRACDLDFSQFQPPA